MLHATLWINLEDIVLREIHVLRCTVAQKQDSSESSSIHVSCQISKDRGRMVAVVSQMEMNSGAGGTAM